MITAFNTETAHQYGDEYPMMLKCRHREFVERSGYEVPTYNGMEYDQYDTPAAVYLTWRDENKTLRAGIRMKPTDRAYMIRDLWPQTVKDIELPNSPGTWEVSRLFVDRNMPQPLRRQAHGEILCGMLEFGLHHDITDYIAIAAPHLWQHTFRKCGWPATPIGPVVDIGYSEKVQTCIMRVSEDIQMDVQSIMDINYSVVPPGFWDKTENVLVDRRALSEHRIAPQRKARSLREASRGLLQIDR